MTGERGGKPEVPEQRGQKELNSLPDILFASTYFVRSATRAPSNRTINPAYFDRFGEDAG